MPGGYRISLTPGTYYLCFFNPAAISKAVVYTLQRYAMTDGHGGEGASAYPSFGTGQTGWDSLSNYSRMKLTIPEVRNPSTTRTTGSLRVSVVAGRGPSVVKGTGRIIALASYSTLAPDAYFSGRVTTVRMNRPPRGRVRTALVLSEFDGGSFKVRDVKVFPGSSRFFR
jgi:hypothetical protein